jgi:predicted regulator of Ras-like GTPase activity (Roadblock/LC7/MglB family)
MPDNPQVLSPQQIRLSPRQQAMARENLGELVGTIRGVRDAVLVSCDGLLLHHAGTMLNQAQAESLAALTGMMLGGARGAGEVIGEDTCDQLLAMYGDNRLIFTAVTDLAGLLVLADREARLGIVGEAIARLVESMGPVLAPQARGDLPAGTGDPELRR